MDFFEVAHTQRSIRRFKPDPVPEAVLWKVLDTAIRAPSSGNSQPWIWLVVRDEGKRNAIARELRQRAEASGGLEQMRQRAAREQDPSNRRIWASAADLRADMAQAPVFIVPCLYTPGVPAANQRTLGGGSSIFGAVQNLMLAARAEGLGTTLTGATDDLLRAELHIPEGAVPACLIPMGYPDVQRFGPTTRKPVETVTYWDDWGAAKKRA
jgi:nitroreductase